MRVIHLFEHKKGSKMKITDTVFDWTSEVVSFPFCTFISFSFISFSFIFFPLSLFTFVCSCHRSVFIFLLTTFIYIR